MIRLFPHCKIIYGKLSSCIYDLVRNEVFELESQLSKKIIESDLGKDNINFSSNELEVINELTAKDFCFNSDQKIGIEEIRVGYHLNQRKLFGQYGAGLSDLFLVITGECNLNCTFCDTSNNIKRLTGCKKWEMDETLTEEDYYSIIEFSYRNGARNLHILGGNPILRNSLLINICEKAKLVGFSNVIIYTPGENVKIVDLKDKCDLIVIHITGYDEKTYNNICKNGDFSKCKENIVEIINNKIPVYFNICLTPEVFKGIDVFEEFISEIKPTGYSYSYIHFDSDNAEYMKALYDIKIKISSFSDLFFFHAERFHPCLYGKLTVFADGTVTVCPLMKNESIGNIRNNNINSIIMDQNYLKYWEMNLGKIDGCKNCGYRYACLDCRAIEASKTNSLYGKEYCEKIIHKE